jgi:hypothetical protein
MAYRMVSLKYSKKLKTKAFTLLGGKCVNPYNLPHPDWCNYWRCLQVDHKNGGGRKEKKKLGTNGIYNRVLKHPEEYQLLCSNCNWIKRYENKECPNYGIIQDEIRDDSSALTF